MPLQRLIITFKPEEVIFHALYRRGADGPNPGTKGRAREVTDLVRSGLQDALEALEGGADCVGTSGFAAREDVLLATTSPSEANPVKGA